MSQKRYFWEIVSFCLIWLTLFICFFVIIFTSSNSNTDHQLETTVSIAERIFDGTNETTATTSGSEVKKYFLSTDERDVRVSIIEKDSDLDYTILFDSQNKTASEEKANELDPDNIGSIVKRNSSYNYKMIYIAIKDKENPSYYVRASIRESVATEVSRNFLIYGSIVIVGIMGIYIFYKVNEYKKSIKPLKDQIGRLAYVAGEEKDSLNENNDLVSLTDSVNRVSKTLDKKINDLEIEKSKTKVILDSMDQGFFALSGSGNIVLFNQAASDIFKYQENDVLNKNYSVLTLNDDFSSRIKEALTKKEDEKAFDYERASRIYQVKIMSLNYSWTLDDSTGLAILIMDVTEERNLSKTKSDFFSNASHELKSPLTSILGYQEMIDAGIFTTEEDKKDAVKKTIKEAKRMKAILADMCTINKLENEKQEDIQKIDLKDSITLSLESLDPAIKKMGLTVNADLKEYPVVSNQSDMDKLFQNLLSNAVKYNRKKGSIIIKMDPLKKFISIKDTGIGIKEENLPRIFERFYRVDNSRGENSIEGTGLGLAIVKHICKLYDFKVEVKSVFGEGTEFIIRTK
jgi:two-component system phosphate regulon sensor histidine kinase PhoR